MRKSVCKLIVLLLFTAVASPATAQFNLGKAVGGALKAGKALTLTDEQMAAYVKIGRAHV